MLQSLLAVAERSRKITQSKHAGKSTYENLQTIYVSIELSKNTWLITSISPGAGEKLSRHSVPGGEYCTGLLARLAQLKQKARDRTGQDYPFVTGHPGGRSRRFLGAQGSES